MDVSKEATREQPPPRTPGKYKLYSLQNLLKGENPFIEHCISFEIIKGVKIEVKAFLCHFLVISQFFRTG